MGPGTREAAAVVAGDEDELLAHGEDEAAPGGELVGERARDVLAGRRGDVDRVVRRGGRMAERSVADE